MTSPPSLFHGKHKAQGDNAADAETVAQLSGEFYMAVPHVFSRSQRPPPIDSLELLQEKFDMVCGLEKI